MLSNYLKIIKICTFGSYNTCLILMMKTMMKKVIKVMMMDRQGKKPKDQKSRLKMWSICFWKKIKICYKKI